MLTVQQNYFLYLAKILNTSAKLFFMCVNIRLRILRCRNNEQIEIIIISDSFLHDIMSSVLEKKKEKERERERERERIMLINIVLFFVKNKTNYKFFYLKIVSLIFLINMKLKFNKKS